MKQTCMSCKFYKIDDELSGYCRVEKNKDKNDTVQREMVRQDHSCRKWIDCGQQYYIRLGWIKAQVKKKKNSADQ